MRRAVPPYRTAGTVVLACDLDEGGGQPEEKGDEGRGGAAGGDVWCEWMKGIESWTGGE